MANKIAKIDADAMNSLFASELTKAGIKVAAADDKGIINAPQAFEDHQSYLETLKSVMAEDSKSDFAENDPIQD
jgi:DNA-directed RNA polymerase subunit E'/Rpb7